MTPPDFDYNYKGVSSWLPELPKTRSVWYRNRAVSYTREMNVEDLNKDGTIKGKVDEWWEPWPE